MMLRLDPHRTLRAADWKPDPWHVCVAGRAPKVCEGFVADFDYEMQLAFSYDVELDRATIFEGVGLPPDAVVHAYLIADCQSSNTRLSASVPLSGSNALRVELEVPSGTFAGAVELSRGLVLLSPGTSDDGGIAAERIGSRLIGDETFTCRLEGKWSRFPIEAADFSRAGLPDAAWFLRMTHTDLDEPFMGSVRLLVNSNHPAGQAVLSGTDPSTNALVLNALRVDLVRQLLFGLAANEPEIDREFPPDSVGSVAESIAADLLSADLENVLERARNQPVELEMLIQDRVDYLRIDTP